MSPSNAAVLDTARAWWAAGWSPIPIRADGSKEPRGPWRQYQHARASLGELDAWFRSGEDGLGIVCGRVSGNGEAVDFDSEATYRACVAQARAQGLGAVVDKIERGYLERSPRPGFHWFFRSSEVGGNLKLARRPKVGEKGFDVLIEVKAEGGQVVAAPSGGGVHPSGRAYERLAGSPASIAVLTPAERRAVYTLARSFDATPVPTRPTYRAPTGPRGERPGDRYNSDPSTDLQALLEAHGWAVRFRLGEEVFLCRPGKVGGHSATLNYKGCGLLKVFTSSTDFEPDGVYDAFGALAILEFHGDFAAAARTLARRYARPAPVWDFS